MGKKQSRFTVLDSRNQGTKQLHCLYVTVQVVHLKLTAPEGEIESLFE